MSFLAAFGLTEAGWIVFGAMLGYLFTRFQERARQQEIEAQRKQQLEATQRDAEALLREARVAANEEAIKLRNQAELAYVTRQQELTGAEQRLAQRETLINTQLEGFLQREKTIQAQQTTLESRECALEKARAETEALAAARREQLARVAQLSEGEARAQFLKECEQAALRDANELSRRILSEAKNRSEEQARRVISLAIQRYAAQHTYETTTATITLTGDEIKGRIIGREGRNIRAFEALTGVTVLIDDTPGAVVLSGFDPVRREIAREAMQRLILDGRIHPTRIEEVVAKVKEEMDENVRKAGEDAIFRAGVPPLHEDIAQVLGKLKFRMSFSQNVLDHSVEVAHLTGLLAAELGLDIAAAKRAGLLHDLGKALQQDMEGSHAIIGAEFLKRLGEADDIVNGVAAHHDEVPHTCLWGILVSAADAISASRPGARSESMDTYVKRLENLEKIGLSFAGVDKCYAVQAGRELRVFVQPEAVTDEQATALARNLCRKIEDEMQYPGQIRVTVIRETRAVEFAK
ncbi:MAG: ribonuclease Y [Pedosphaera sp. Tous-C6FEB]|nr:MAG: ribonuclease Y [Pedosphaera sp. Tous-C6FEB]